MTPERQFYDHDFGNDYDLKQDDDHNFDNDYDFKQDDDRENIIHTKALQRTC